MRKIIFILAAMAVVASCSQSRKWTDKEGKGLIFLM